VGTAITLFTVKDAKFAHDLIGILTDAKQEVQHHVLFCAFLLHAITFYCSLLHSSVLYCTLLHSITFYCTLLHFTVLYYHSTITLLAVADRAL
jgi:hypothetical protein